MNIVAITVLIYICICPPWPVFYRQVILRYLIVVTGMAPYKLLNHTKRVIVSLGKCKADRLVEELVAELHLVETVNATVDRTETPPYFRSPSECQLINLDL